MDIIDPKEITTIDKKILYLLDTSRFLNNEIALLQERLAHILRVNIPLLDEQEKKAPISEEEKTQSPLAGMLKVINDKICKARKHIAYIQSRVDLQ